VAHAAGKAAHEGGIHKQGVIAVRVVMWPLQGDVVEVWELVAHDLLDGVLQLEPAAACVVERRGRKGAAGGR
jgi:hypothetical protein